MKTIARAYLSNKECLVAETVSHSLAELNLIRISQLCILLKKGVWVSLSEKEMSKLPDDNPNIFRVILIVWWKDQVQHYAMENTVF